MKGRDGKGWGVEGKVDGLYLSSALLCLCYVLPTFTGNSEGKGMGRDGREREKEKEGGGEERMGREKEEVGNGGECAANLYR